MLATSLPGGKPSGTVLVRKSSPAAQSSVHGRRGGGGQRRLAAQFGDRVIAHAVADENQVFHRLIPG
jgi:hypothetical protein